ncbi:MAG: YdeI/OmpD-associated family protein [Planctomycetota bacterium]
MKGVKTVDAYLAAHPEHASVLEKLRGILVDSGMEETLKWSAPAYVRAGKNVVTLAAFKEHCALWFHQGALMEDADGRFEDPEEVKSKAKAMRQWRFKTARDVRVRELRAYVKEAMALVDQGRAVAPERGKPVEVPPELDAALRGKTRKAFDALSLGKRREYAEYISEAKREATKEKRIEKILPMIQGGVGLNDKYRK